MNIRDMYLITLADQWAIMDYRTDGNHNIM